MNKNVIKEMNKKIGEDLGVDVVVEVIDTTKKMNSKSTEKRKAFFKEKNIKENRFITKAMGNAQAGADNVLELLNNSIMSKQDMGQGTVPAVSAEPKNYREIMEGNKYINIEFSTYNPDGNYETVDGENLIILENSEMQKYGQSNTYKQKAIFLNREVCVKVIRIEGNCVYVTPAGSTEYALKNSTKELINAEISRSLSQDKHPVVFGKVISVRPNSLMVNILDADIVGFLNRSHWSKLFTRTLEGLCKEGDYLQFEVLRQADKKEGTNSKAWILGRENIVPNPWDAVNIESLQVGNIMVVKCMEKPAGKSYWWGVTDRLPGVEIMGDYTKNYSEAKGLYAGLSYQCKVDAITQNERNGGYKVKVVPIVVMESDRAHMDSIHRKLGVKTSGGK